MNSLLMTAQLKLVRYRLTTRVHMRRVVTGKNDPNAPVSRARVALALGTLATLAFAAGAFASLSLEAGGR